MTIIHGTFTINSTLDNVKNLYSKYTYDNQKTNLPIVVMIHGFGLTIDAITQTIMTRIANNGYFVVAIGMRGRKGATGSRDASGRELHDIYDGINHIKANFPVSDKVIVSGYSGGGGNALGFAVKFPFVANTIVNHFGMVDYGFDDVESWYMRNNQYRSSIRNFVGHARTPENMNYYRTRNMYEALSNLQAKVFSYHDSEDTGVSVELTNYLTGGLQTLDKPHTTKISNPSDNVRYLHDMSVSVKTEPEWLPYGKQTNKPTMENSGTFRVLGYLVTDHFKIFLGNLDDCVADVVYDINNNSFTITPLSQQTMDVTVVIGNLQQTQTIQGETSFVFEGEEVTPPELPEITGIVKKQFVKQFGEYVPVKNSYIKVNEQWVIVK